jgi:hypothetical protein
MEVSRKGAKEDRKDRKEVRVLLASFAILAVKLFASFALLLCAFA